MNRIALSILAAGTALVAMSAPAQAVTCVNPNAGGGTAPANLIGSTGQVLSCIGYYKNGGTQNNNSNLLNSSGTNEAKVEAALLSLGLDIDVDSSFFADPNKVFTIPSPYDSIAFPNTTLFGDTYVGIHVGGNVGTAFFKLHFDTPVTSFAYNGINFSGASLFSTEVYTPEVPEPASWAMMILGLGLVGSAMRARKSSVSFA